MNNKFIRGAVGFAAVSAITLSGGMAFAKDAISIAVPSFLTGGAAGPFGIPAMNGAKMVAEQRSLLRQPVDPWGLQVRMPHTAKSIPALVIGKDEDHIGPLSMKQG